LGADEERPGDVDGGAEGEGEAVIGWSCLHREREHIMISTQYPPAEDMVELHSVLLSLGINSFLPIQSMRERKEKNENQ
jgi:hypothetical protein